MEETPIYTAIHMIGQQIAGWPMYLFFNVTGHNNHFKQTEGKGAGRFNGFGGGVSHFLPNSPLYERKDEKLILLSDLGLAITLSVLTLVGKVYGFQAVFVWYIVPWFWVHHWLGKHPILKY
jgi:omega-6 fatty acid desaturase (delta-12 desaturase)